ncbi:MAG: divalent metal cation transporter [Planctomycetota bacterium]
MATTTDTAGTVDSSSASTETREANSPNSRVASDRQLLQTAQAEGRTLGAYVRLSGPGWLQSAITLGGGSLAGGLFLGTLGGVSLLWLQLVAIVFGVVMLSAISYVTLSTGRRPFEAINTEINPALGWGWLIATAMANVIWCMPQFSLCYDALDNNLFTIGGRSGLGDSNSMKWTVTAGLLVAAAFVVLLKVKEGAAAKWFDRFLKALIGMVVICFFGVTILLIRNGQVDFGAVFAGLIPDLSQWARPAGDLRDLVGQMSPDASSFWSEKIMTNQRTVMIAAAATAVGINMTFLLPYSMLARGWDKPFRGLARFDLSTGMAIPYVIVTSCVVIAAAASFHASADEAFLSPDPATFRTSALFDGAAPAIADRLGIEVDQDDRGNLVWTADQIASVAAVSADEKRVAASLVKRNAFQLSQTLSPLLGETGSKLIFGLGVFGMGFSTIIILMLINGYAFREMLHQPQGNVPFVLGVLTAGVCGAMWVVLWGGKAKFWLAIFASTFGMMLLPIAYVTFFLMMNSRRILGDEMPTGASRLGWNLMMGAAVIGAIAAAATAIYDKAMDKANPEAFTIVISLLVVYGALVAVGFFRRRTGTATA